MVFTQRQTRERYVSVFDVAAYAALRVARYFAEASRKAKREQAARVAKRPQKDARKSQAAQAPPRANVERMRDEVDLLRMQGLL
jgi:hypothetical protein